MAALPGCIAQRAHHGGMLLLLSEEAALLADDAGLGAEQLFPIDAGPFESVGDAVAHLRRWLREYWHCHKTGDANSCFEWGGCHRRCWWRTGTRKPLAVRVACCGLSNADPRLASVARERPPDCAEAIGLTAFFVAFGDETYIALRPV